MLFVWSQMVCVNEWLHIYNYSNYLQSSYDASSLVKYSKVLTTPAVCHPIIRCGAGQGQQHFLPTVTSYSWRQPLLTPTSLLTLERSLRPALMRVGAPLAHSALATLATSRSHAQFCSYCEFQTLFVPHLTFLPLKLPTMLNFKNRWSEGNI